MPVRSRESGASLTCAAALLACGGPELHDDLGRHAPAVFDLNALGPVPHADGDVAPQSQLASPILAIIPHIGFASSASTLCKPQAWPE